MKKINWQTTAIILSILISFVLGGMRFAKLEERVKNYRDVQAGTNTQFIESMKGLTKSINQLTTTTDSLRYEIKFINFKNSL